MGPTAASAWSWSLMIISADYGSEKKRGGTGDETVNHNNERGDNHDDDNNERQREREKEREKERERERRGSNSVLL